MNNIIINKSVEKLIEDIKKTKDHFKKTILEKLLEIKLKQEQMEEINNINDYYNDVPSIDTASNYISESNSDHLSDIDINNDENNMVDNTNNNEDQINNDIGENIKKRTIKDIFNDQENSLNRLDRLNKLKAYHDLIEENNKEKTYDLIKEKRGKMENVWGTDELYDPKYSKYMEEDYANNKMMERLNNEIDFRLNENKCIKIIKPYDNMSDNNDSDDSDESGDSNDNIKILRRYNESL